MVLDFRREGTPALLPSYVLAGRFDRPAGALARELLGVRTLVALQAVRMAARYADAAGIAEARAILARAPALEADRVAHSQNELELFRALVCASGIWPAVWLANVFWAPMRELHGMLAGAVGAIAPGYQADMAHLLDLIEIRNEPAAEAHLAAFFAPRRRNPPQRARVGARGCVHGAPRKGGSHMSLILFWSLLSVAVASAVALSPAASSSATLRASPRAT